MYERMSEFANKKRNIKRRTNKLFIILILNLIVSICLGNSLLNYNLVLIEMFLTIIQTEDIYKNLIIMMMQLISTFGPTALSIFCSVKMSETSKEYESVCLEEAEYLSEQIFEEKKPMLDEMLKQGKGISRKELMNLLNMTKTELRKRENIKNKKVVGPDEKLLIYFQHELEDIVFPSNINEEKGRSRTRKK